MPFLVFEVPIFTKVLERQDSAKTPKEQLPKMLRFDLTRLSQIFFFLSISWNFDTSKFLCVLGDSNIDMFGGWGAYTHTQTHTDTHRHTYTHTRTHTECVCECV